MFVWIPRDEAGAQGEPTMELIRIDSRGNLYLSSDIDDWAKVDAHGISVVIDLDGDLDADVPTEPGELLYVYFPFEDRELPDLARLHAVAGLGAELLLRGRKVLCHCLMGYNRSALVVGLILVHLGMSGAEALARLRDQRPGALFNDRFAEYLSSLPAGASRTDPSERKHEIRFEK